VPEQHRLTVRICRAPSRRWWVIFGSRVSKPWSLLNHDRHGFWRNLLLALDFLALLVGLALAGGNLVERLPLRLTLQDGREVVVLRSTSYFVDIAGEDGRQAGQARAVLVAASGGEPPDTAAVWEYGAADRGAASAHRIGCGRKANRAKEGNGRVGV
jgi:hypothetical protein